MEQDNRRRAQRLPVVAVASLQTCGSMNVNNQAFCTVQDLSKTGIGLETGQPPVEGQGVILRLALGDEIVEIKTRATRVTQKPGSHFYSLGLDWGTCSSEQLAFFERVLGATENPPARA